MSKLYCGNSDCGAYLGSMGADSCVHCGWIDPDAIEAAATEPLLQRIAELEKENARLHRQNTFLLDEKSKAESEAKELFNAFVKREKNIAELEHQLKEWQNKTEWVQESAKAGEFGMHRADVLALRIAELERQLEALRSQIGQGVPDGWQLVPKEPTDEMFFDPDNACTNFGESPGQAFRRMYQSLLASAPPAPQGEPTRAQKMRDAGYTRKSKGWEKDGEEDEDQ